MPYLEVADYMSPITLLVGNNIEKEIKKTAKITVRYSDAPKDAEVDVQYVVKDMNTIRVQTAKHKEIKSFRIK